MPNRRRFDACSRPRPQPSSVGGSRRARRPRRPTASRWSAPLRRSCASTSPSARARLPTTIRSGQPSSSASVELLARPGVAVVESTLEAGLAELARRGAPPPRAPRRRPCRARRRAPPRRERARPDDPLLVGALLDRRGDDPRRPDPVAAHDDRPLLAVRVEVGRAERLRVARPELEDVADLDRRLDLDRVAARRQVPGLDRAEVELARTRSRGPARPRSGACRRGWRPAK